MKTLTTAASMLRGMADRLDESRHDLLLPSNAPDIAGTAEELRLLLGEEYFSIKCEFDYHYHHNVSVKWEIYSNNTFHHGNTLAEALAACKLANTPKQVGNPADSIQLVTEALTQF